MTPEENPLDPAYWQILGVTPIVVDPDSPESIAEGLARIGEELRRELNELLED